MAQIETLSKRPALRFWGWGYADEHLTVEEDRLVEAMAKTLAPDNAIEVPSPRLSDFNLPAARLAVPKQFRTIVSTTTYDRLVHSYGKSFGDIVRMFLHQVNNPPDWVAFPLNEQDISDLLAYAGEHSMAVIPFGGGTSVCGGVEADVGGDYRGTISLDMQHFNQVLEIDSISRAARVQGGILGPDLEQQLKTQGYTLRHFPQSFRFSTLGGWIATRAGGHFASVYTHIDDFVESTRLLTPSGVIASRRLPGSGAGPSADRMVLGSEGILGIVTEAWVRLQSLPKWKASVTVRFANFVAGAEAVRLISQSGLFPSNCRLLDETEVHWNHLAPEPCALLVLGFESADHQVHHWMSRALEIVGSQNGQFEPVTYSNSADQVKDQTPDSTAESWRNAFIRMPYYRNRLVGFGIIADTFETAISWDKFDALYAGVKKGMLRAIMDITGQPGLVSCRFTHIYPDGPAPYFTFFALGDKTGNLTLVLDNWRKLKLVANDLVVGLGGTVTHHHAVGRDHRSGYEQQSPELYRQTLAAAKAYLDPKAVLNPGVLIDPVGKKVGMRGVLFER
jgi:alkyldihydroxyacetonephosphate synthase|tara:strand:- start:37 stop:1725 length:1689 start_codon:yes stop_codon:yes gene_type:complete